jgi:HSP20 family protein
MSFLDMFGYDPFRQMWQLQSNMGKLIAQMAAYSDVPTLEHSPERISDEGSTPSLGKRSRDASSGALVASRERPQLFWPLVDVKDSDSAITVHAELPGLRKEDINIHVENNTLHISGERSQEKKEENERWHRVERSFGSFRRSFRLPEGVKEDEIKASCKDGVLEVVVPKKPASKKKATGKKIRVE